MFVSTQLQGPLKPREYLSPGTGAESDTFPTGGGGAKPVAFHLVCLDYLATWGASERFPGLSAAFGPPIPYQWMFGAISLLIYQATATAPSSFCR